jgi:prevent-host-death family protein
MRSIGVRELKANTSRVLREVSETAEPLEITVRGRPVARLVPIGAVRAGKDDAAAVWADLDDLAAQIGSSWPPDTSATEAVREGRRDL